MLMEVTKDNSGLTVHSYNLGSFKIK